MTTFPLLAILLPFAAAFAGLLLSRRPRRRGRPNTRAAWIAILPTTASALLATYLAWNHGFAYFTVTEPTATAPPTGQTYGTIVTGGIPISLTIQADDLSAILGVLVTAVALAVQVYSVGYLKDDPRYPSYSAFISLFTSAMLLVIYAGDLLVLYVGWEIMGLCSYLLIGHWWEDRSNSRAAVKAFLVTRLGDVGFLFGIFVLGTAAGSFRIADVLAKVPEMSQATLVTATMLLLAGVAGKSAQVPLHTWLPDAMAGPTPISALIHAATMVAAGIFIVARLFGAFLGAQATLDVLAVLAALGMLGAALAALAQDDLKRVLAYSTVSQLAYMAGGLAAGSDTAAIFHLLTHGAFKALLFLCAGAVIHHVGSNLMTQMGGLRRELPVTFVTMTIGFAALMGLPPASGFFSKDGVLLAMDEALSTGGLTDAAALLLYGCALATVAITGAYAARAWLRTFFGQAGVVALPEPEPGMAHVVDVREAPRTMLVPVVLLAVPALLLGFAVEPHLDLGVAAISVVLALLGAGAVYAFWRMDPVADPARFLGPLRVPCERAFYVDELYATLFVRPVLALARLVVRTDDVVVDGAVRGSGRSARGLSGVLRLAQNGNVQLYVSGVLAGVLLIVIGGGGVLVTGWLPTALLTVPLLGALLLLLAPQVLGRAYGLVLSGLTLALSLLLVATFDYGAPARVQFEIDQPWIPGLGLRFHLGVDGISLPLIALTALLTFLCFVYLFKDGQSRPRALVFTLLVLEVGMIGTFLALDLLLFFVFFEIVLIPMYFLIGIWGGEGRRAASIKFILYTLLGSVVMLLGLLLVWAQTGTLDIVALSAAHGAGMARSVQILAFVAIGIGLAVKTPMWPLHTWLPDAHTEAPTVGSVLLAGVLLKMGTYGFARIAIPVLPEGAAAVAPWLGAFAVVGIVYGALACLAQRDLKRMIAYSSVGHMGFVLLGFATLTPVGINGALFANVAHGLITGLLFFLAGAIKERYHTADMPSLGGGLLARLPRLGSVLTFACIASLGLPGLAGFWGEMLALFGAFQPASGLPRGLFLTYMVIGGLGAVLTAAYFLVMLSRVTHGRPQEKPDESLSAPSSAIKTLQRTADVKQDIKQYELLAWTPLVILTLLFGLWPGLLLSLTTPSVQTLLGAFS